MRRRQRLNNRDLYDILTDLNDTMKGGVTYYFCIVELMKDDYIYDEDKERCFHHADCKKCEECIQRYINEEE